jgi:hypothetical protein
MKFYERLRHLGTQDVAAVVSEIVAKCPSAFKENGEDNAQILVDSLDGKTFTEVMGMMEGILLKTELKIANKIKSQ